MISRKIITYSYQMIYYSEQLFIMHLFINNIIYKGLFITYRITSSGNFMSCCNYSYG